MNTIPEVQNSPQRLDELAAQRELYTRAKRVHTVQTILTGPIAVAVALLALLAAPTRPYVALWSAAVTLADLLWLNPMQRRLKTDGARVQEAFDCTVLGLPWNEIAAGGRPDAELVAENAALYAPRAERMPTLRDWYPPVVGALPLSCARAICQRENCQWDGKLRRRYAAAVWTFLGVAVVGVVVVGLLRDLKVIDWVTSVVLPIIPAVILGIRQGRENIESATRLDELKAHAVRAWEGACSGRAESRLSSDSRALQDELFASRKRSPLVFDWVFKLLRDRYERQASRAADELVAEAKNRLRIN